MNVAKARYTGRKRKHTVDLPSGESVVFRARTHGEWVDIENAEDARRLEEKLNYEVEWRAGGEILARGKEILELGYQKKRSIASELEGISFDGTPSEDELDEQIEDHIEALEGQNGG